VNAERKFLDSLIHSKFEIQNSRLRCLRSVNPKSKIPHTRARVPRFPSGFTLLEILVSLSIVAIAITVVLQLFSADLRALSVSEDYLSAVTKAEAKMREVLDNEDLKETSWSEATPDGYRTEVTVAEVLKERTDLLQVKLLEVGLTVYWIKGTKEKKLTLRTMKVVNKIESVTSRPKV
jgi:prepilin-type N-terminal cleavage/methylation domain-containing protein